MFAETLDLVARECRCDAVDERQLAGDVAVDAVNRSSRGGERRALNDESSSDRMTRGFERRERFAFRSGCRRARSDQAREASDADQSEQARQGESPGQGK